MKRWIGVNPNSEAAIPFCWQGSNAQNGDSIEGFNRTVDLRASG
jgi:hypothetical protein